MEIDFSLISNKFHLKRDWYRAEDPGSVRSLFEEICRELEDRNLRLLRAFVLALIAKVADWSIREIETAEEYIPQKKYHLVQAICRKLEQRENYSVPIPQLIAKEPIGYRLFQKIFSEWKQRLLFFRMKLARANHGRRILLFPDWRRRIIREKKELIFLRKSIRKRCCSFCC